MNGLLLWGLVLPILLVVAGTVVLIRRRNSRRHTRPSNRQHNRRKTRR